jgi:hypothetical protein
MSSSAMTVEPSQQATTTTTTTTCMNKQAPIVVADADSVRDVKVMKDPVEETKDDHKKVDGDPKEEKKKPTKRQHYHGTICESGLSDKDILMGRGSGPSQYKGNIWFRGVVWKTCEEYLKEETSQQPMDTSVKTRLSKLSFKKITDEGGRFLQKITKNEAKILKDNQDDDGLVVVLHSDELVSNQHQTSFYVRVDEKQVLLKIKQTIRFLVDQRESSSSTTSPSSSSPKRSASGGSTIMMSNNTTIRNIHHDQKGGLVSSATKMTPAGGSAPTRSDGIPFSQAAVSLAAQQEALELLLSFRFAQANAVAASANAADALAQAARTSLPPSLMLPGSISNNNTNETSLSLLEMIQQQRQQQERMLLHVQERYAATERERRLLQIMKEMANGGPPLAASPTSSGNPMLQSLLGSYSTSSVSSPFSSSSLMYNNNLPSLETLRFLARGGGGGSGAAPAPTPSSFITSPTLSSSTSTMTTAAAATQPSSAVLLEEAIRQAQHHAVIAAAVASPGGKPNQY